MKLLWHMYVLGVGGASCTSSALGVVAYAALVGPAGAFCAVSSCKGTASCQVVALDSAPACCVAAAAAATPGVVPGCCRSAKMLPQNGVRGRQLTGQEAVICALRIAHTTAVLSASGGLPPAALLAVVAAQEQVPIAPDGSWCNAHGYSHSLLASQT